MDVILGIDFGTSKIATVLVDPSDGMLVGSSSRSTEAYCALEDTYKREQDLRKIRAAFSACMDELLAGREVNVVSAGLTGQMHGILGLDAVGRPVTNFVTWQDERGEHRGKDGKTLLEQMEERAGTRPIATGYGVVTLYDWFRESSVRGMKCICTLPDYFGMIMTGRREAVIDSTFADSLGCYDSVSHNWDCPYLEGLGIDPGCLPRIVPTASRLGAVEEAGLLKLMRNGRVPVSTALGDNQASFIGSVREFYTTLLINVGTASQISYAVRSFDEVRQNCIIDGYDVVVRPFVENGLLVAGNALAGGAAYTVLYEFFKLAGEELFDVREFDGLWERMSCLAEQGSGTGGMGVRAVFGGRRSDPMARGAVEGLSLTNFTPSNLIRATLKGIIEVLHDMMDEDALTRIERVVGSGNGMRKNRPLRNIASEIFGYKILIPLNEEEAAIGAAVTGAVAAGVFDDFEDGKKAVGYIE